jgi:hypothetical protein
MNPFTSIFDPKTAVKFAGTNPGFSFTTKGLEKLGVFNPTPAPAASAFTPAETSLVDDLLKTANELNRFRPKPLDLKSIPAEERSTVAILQGLQGFDPGPTILAAVAQQRAAETANKMQRANLDYASQKSKERQARDFTYARLNDLFTSIPRAFSPIPYEKTQELAANIANISSPRNLSAQPGIQAASYALPTRQYFA